MNQPCSNCPFRSDKPFTVLTVNRAEGILYTIKHDGNFNCHKTLEFNVPRLCVGSAIFLENTVRGGMYSNVMYRLGARCGLIAKPDELSNSVPVYQSNEKFIEGVTYER